MELEDIRAESSPPCDRSQGNRIRFSPDLKVASCNGREGQRQCLLNASDQSRYWGHCPCSTGGPSSRVPREGQTNGRRRPRRPSYLLAARPAAPHRDGTALCGLGHRRMPYRVLPPQRQRPMFWLFLVYVESLGMIEDSAILEVCSATRNTFFGSSHPAGAAARARRTSLAATPPARRGGERVRPTLTLLCCDCPQWHGWDAAAQLAWCCWLGALAEFPPAARAGR
jgi:hypothetical protein